MVGTLPLPCDSRPLYHCADTLVHMVDGLDTNGLLVAVAYWLVPVAVMLVVGLRPLGKRIDGWAEARGVPLTAETRPFVTAHLTRARRWRTIGLAVGWSVPAVEMLVIRRSAYEGTSMDWAFLAGYLLGALAAEVWAAHATHPTGAAVVNPRQVDDYLPLGARRWVRVVALGSVALIPLYAAVPERDDWPSPSTAGFALRTGLVLALLVGAEVLPRLIVRRRQAFHSGDLLTADDAVRSWSAHAVTGILLASMLLVVASQVLAFSSWEFRHSWIAQIGTYGLMLTAIGTFQLLSSYDWRWRVPTASKTP